VKYLYLFRTSLLEIIEYRANIPARSLAFIINLSLTLLLWLAVTGVKGEIFSYSRNEIIYYFLFLSAILPLVIGGGDFAQKIGSDIKNGDLGGILLKPVTPFRYYLSLAVSERIKDFITTLPLVFIVYLFIQINVSLEFRDVLILFLSLAFTFALNHLFMAMIGLMGFWTTEIGWTSTFIVQVINLFSGVRFPINFYPQMIFNLIGITPFLYFGYFPASIFLKRNITNMGTAFLVQFIWLVTLFILLKRIWSIGIKRYEGASQ